MIFLHIVTDLKPPPTPPRHLLPPTKKPLPLEGFLFFLVRTGLEPVTPCVTGMYSNQLN